MRPAPELARRCYCQNSIGFCGFLGQVLSSPAPDHITGPLLQYAQASNLGFLPLRGERDEEYQFGLTIPVYGWTIDVDHFRTQAKNFFDHNNIGNSNAFLPLTIDGALIAGNELTVRSPDSGALGKRTSRIRTKLPMGMARSTAA